MMKLFDPETAMSAGPFWRRNLVGGLIGGLAAVALVELVPITWLPIAMLLGSAGALGGMALVAQVQFHLWDRWFERNFGRGTNG